MAGSHSRRKGAAGEREQAKFEREVLGLGTYRTAQRTGEHGDGDLKGSIPGTHREHKRVKQCAAFRYLRQAEADAKDGDIPLVSIRVDGDTEPVYLLRCRDVRELAKRIADS